MNLKTTEERVEIDGIKGFSSGTHASSPHGCQATILEGLGENLTYADLVGYGGFIFRTSVHSQMCPSAGHPCCGFDCTQGSNRALPWRITSFESTPWGEPKADRPAFEAEVAAAIKASIDRGIPVHYQAEEDGLIIGYADEGRRWWCLHPYHENGTVAFWHEQGKGFAGGNWPWFIRIWTEPKPEAEVPSERDLTIAALNQAVKMWETDKREEYLLGETAYALWLDWLEGVENREVVEPRKGMQGNGWCFDVLIQNRRIAGEWLRAKAAKHPDAVGECLATAADHYTRIAEACMEDQSSSWELALPPDRFNDWTSEMRQSQVARLKTARTHDRSAISAIKAALELLAKEFPSSQ